MDNKAQIANRIYPGVDLTVKFAFEIASAPYNGNPWAWIKARIQAVNYSGILVGDYIPFVLTDGKSFKADIAGIDTYYNYGDTAVGHHIDFITRDCHSEVRAWNRTNYNNGISGKPNPCICNDLYAWLNGLAMDVPNGSGADPDTVAVDYTTDGVLPKLPPALRNIIVQKRALIPQRHSVGVLLTDDNGWHWKDVGLLWLPSEVEVYGCSLWGSNSIPNQGYTAGGYVQYPIFDCNMKRVKGAGDGGERSSWWLGSVRGGNSTNACSISNTGDAASANAGLALLRVPICFRIA